MTYVRRNKSEWRTMLTADEANEVDGLAEEALMLDARRREITAKLNLIRQRACQRMLAEARKAAQ